MKHADSRISPVAFSSALHITVAGAIALLMTWGPGERTVENIAVRVIENPKPAPPNLNLAQPQETKPEPQKPQEPARKVFGTSKKALTSDEPGPGIAVKQGNTLATTPDNEKLKDSDAGSLPIPTDEYLVSKMPSVKTRLKIPYPPEAKENRVAGLVVMELLIDTQGLVREAKLIRGPGYGLNEAAIAAIKQFKFSPAEADGKPVAVRTQFTYEFILEE